MKSRSAARKEESQKTGTLGPPGLSRHSLAFYDFAAEEKRRADVRACDKLLLRLRHFHPRPLAKGPPHAVSK